MAQALPFLFSAQAVNSAGAAYTEAEAARADGDYQKRIFDLNARISKIRAADSIRRGDEKSNTARRASARLVSSQRVAAAGQGLDVNVGSVADLRRDEQLLSEIDRITIRNNAYSEAWGFKVQESDYSLRGQFAAASGRRRR